jgi:3',5'-cyclic AMP phosphodiesterase CpdA
MSTKPTLIAQISDLHIKPVGELTSGRVDAAADLTRCVKEINRLHPRPDLVVISGDLVDSPLQGSYDHLVRLLAPLEIPFAAIPGNHDNRELMRAALPDPLTAKGNGAMNSLRAAHPLDIVLVDSTSPGEPHGELDAATLAWLDSTLGASTTRPALVFLHHPPFATGIGHMDAQNLRNGADLAAILRTHPRIRLLAMGHVHRTATTQFAGIPATICPAPNHAVTLELDGHLPPSFTIEPPAFHLHVWLPEHHASDQSVGSLVTHWVPIGVFSGPHPYFDSEGNFI